MKFSKYTTAWNIIHGVYYIYWKGMLVLCNEILFMKFFGFIRKWKWIFSCRQKNDIFNGKLVFGYLPFEVTLNLQDRGGVYVLAYNCSFSFMSLPFFCLFIPFVIQWLWRKNSFCNVWFIIYLFHLYQCLVFMCIQVKSGRSFELIRSCLLSIWFLAFKFFKLKPIHFSLPLLFINVFKITPN